MAAAAVAVTATAATAMLLAAQQQPAMAGTTQIPIVRLDESIEVGASPADVWAYMTAGKNLVTWCPYWKSGDNAAVSITQVGDVLDFTDGWGNGGRSVVTYCDVNQELRLAHEPTNGSYICQAKLILEPSGEFTRVHYVEQYTDESAPDELQTTAEQMQHEVLQTLATLKAGVEKN